MDGAKDDIRITSNQGFVSRHKLTELSQSVDLEGPIYADHADGSLSIEWL